MKPGPILFASACAAAWLCLPNIASAADPTAQSRNLTDGVDRPIHDYSGEGDASSLELNPALLNSVEGLDITAIGYQSTYEYSRGTGFGAFLSANIGWGFAIGFGIQALDPGFTDGKHDFDADHNQRMTKVGLALAGGDRRGKYMSLGLAIQGVRHGNEWLRRPDFDLGLVARGGRWASLGIFMRSSPLVLHDPLVYRSQFIVGGELALRPLGSRHVELAGGVAAPMQRDPNLPVSQQSERGLLPRGRVALRYGGWAIHGELEQVAAVQLDESTLARTADVKALRGSIAIDLSWDYTTIGTGMHMGLGPGVDGVSMKARFSSTRQGRVFPARPIVVERLDLSKLEDERGVLVTLAKLEAARKAGPRSVLLVEARDVDLGYGSLQEIRAALVRVRNAGGHVIAYVEHPKLAEYFVASAAEKIFMHPGGELETYGLASRTLYFKDALAKIGVRVEALHIDEYKSAHERFTRNSRSEKDREQRMELLDHTYEQVVHDIAVARSLPLSEVRALIDEAPYGPEAALEAGLVDEVMHRDERAKKISELVGRDVEFRPLTPHQPEEAVWDEQRYIAVVLIEGTIIDGKSRDIPILDIHMTGGDTIADLIKKARGDRRCEGIVVRVNSGGGSAMASEVMWRQIELTHEAWKKDPKFSPPIVVSMSDVAASGGYYVSTGADKVYAQPTTITGSIGVVSMHFDVSGLLEKLGIQVDTLKKGRNPDMFGFFEPYSNDQKRRQQASMERIYTLFTKRVADARGKTVDEVDALGRGRVYSGKAALAHGLIDEYGGLYEAITELRKRSRVRERERLGMRILPKEPTLLELVLGYAGSLISDPASGRAQRKLNERRNKVPLALDRAVARLPLSILYLPQDRASIIWDGEVRIH